MIKKMFIAALSTIVVLMVIGLLSGGSGSLTYAVTYYVGGTTDRASVTYTNKDGGISQISSVELPWTIKFQANWGTVLTITAQNKRGSGSIITKIYVDGTVFKESLSEGEYVISSSSVMLTGLP